MLAGYGILWNDLSDYIDGFRERFIRGAFAEYLAGNPKIYALINHQENRELGDTHSGTLKVTEDSRGLRFQLTPVGFRGELIKEQFDNRELQGVSIRFGPKKVRWVYEDGCRIREIQAATISEISLCDRDVAYPSTRRYLRSLTTWRDKELDLLERTI